MANTFSFICISGCTSASAKQGMIWCLESSGYTHPSQCSFQTVWMNVTQRYKALSYPQAEVQPPIQMKEFPP